MDRLTENQYELSISKDKMKKIGFRYDRSFEGYIYTFPVYKYNGSVPMIYCKLGIDEESKRVCLSICDDNDRLYAPYYNDEYGKNTIIKDIEKAISKELNKLGAKRVN